MQFLLIDVAATAAVLVGYRAFVAFDRHRSQLVTLSRWRRSHAQTTRTRSAVH